MIAPMSSYLKLEERFRQILVMPSEKALYHVSLICIHSHTLGKMPAASSKLIHCVCKQHRRCQDCANGLPLVMNVQGQKYYITLLTNNLINHEIS